MRELLASKPSKNRTWGGGIMDEEKELIEIMKKIVEPLNVETFLKLKGYKLTNKSLCNSAGVWENKNEQLAIVFYETQEEQKHGA
ncbi:MAG: hypothetical protein COX35_02805 [Candidatus Nealsonbacteria bacterium CG23_combo_of_CG06-09_8_20_14_all_37_18]|uniref:Uncharacterized protein n=1 Tax=Candidatus Nealsonbacteria bacterium CG23_combo_of_CG06-09_8_20_14_all_37_18 TaxID=1974720 RepID=A0A2G9YXV5_9BACT|nr:MAG: hypothetical protein COX35_02805 [Candidatus Nealsonbacteria bacterium CG23_combo_of_CG06-09_8_20_14_all_37_18]